MRPRPGWLTFTAGGDFCEVPLGRREELIEWVARAPQTRPELTAQTDDLLSRLRKADWTTVVALDFDDVLVIREAFDHMGQIEPEYPDLRELQQLALSVIGRHQ